MIIRHLCFYGPIKEKALVQFEQGFNLVYGASNTGKSSIVDAIDFMLGRASSLKELPEHDGYDVISLGVEFSSDEQFTLFRNFKDSNYQYYEGLHTVKPESIEPIPLKVKATKKIRSVSDLILEKIGLANKKLKRNAANETEKLSIRTLLPLFLIPETDIQKESSPFISHYSRKTAEKSRLKLLLTGVDDNSLVSNKVLEKIDISQSARLEVLDELIEEHQALISTSSDSDNSLEELLSQIEKLNNSLDIEKRLITQSERSYSVALDTRRQLQLTLSISNERSSEITEMLARFALLKQHYETDLLRLESVSEAGSLLAALPTNDCPLCGAKEDAQNLEHTCDGNIEEVVEAAKAEASKIILLKKDLVVAIDTLKAEKSDLEAKAPTLKADLARSNQKIQELSPSLIDTRKTYSDYIDEKTNIENSIRLMTRMAELKGRRTKIVDEKNKPESQAVQHETLSTNSMDKLSVEIRSMLKLWSVPNTGRVHYDNETNDFVFNGKHRKSNGKGHRSITHAAITLGFCKYLEKNKLPTLGFVILDSPLIAYEEPDNEEDDLSTTDINLNFFDSLITWGATQTIIFENKKSIPKKLEQHERTLFFTKNKNSGRYGFFPV